MEAQVHLVARPSASHTCVVSGSTGDDLRFLIVDDHAVLRRGLRELLWDEFPGATFGEAASRREALARVAQDEWSLVILDLSIPGADGFDLLKAIVALRPTLPVLVLSAHAEEQYAIRSLRAGAAGYITKETAPSQLADGVRTVLSGGKHVSAALAQRIATMLLSETDQPPHASLSDRELQVLLGLAAGRSVKEIGAALALSEKTVSTYRARVLEKMNMRSNAELMRYALRAGLVE